MFIEARRLGRMMDRTHREPTGEDITCIADTYHAWRTGNEGDTSADIPDFWRSASFDEVRRHGHVLTPGRYAGVESQEDDGESFEDKMKQLVADLRGQQAEAVRLNAVIRENLGVLGFGGKQA